MEISFSELRNRTHEILLALERNESITLLYRGKPKGVISPIGLASKVRAEDVAGFGMWSDRPEMDSATEYVQSMRNRRRNDI